MSVKVMYEVVDGEKVLSGSSWLYRRPGMTRHLVECEHTALLWASMYGGQVVRITTTRETIDRKAP